MCKPEDWYDQPHQLLERWLWDRDLEYDGYETSKAEEIHSIICNKPPDHDTNRQRLDKAWSHVTEEQYRSRLAELINELSDQVKQLQELLCN